MYQPSIFCIKLQVQFGGDIHEVSVPAYGGAEPTVIDLMNVVERDFRVPRALQNLVFHGQDLHTYPNESLSRFGIKNGVTIRLVGRMAPADMINQINAQQNTYAYQQSYYTQQPNTVPTYQTNEQRVPYYSEQFQYAQKPSIGTQYDPPAPPTPTNRTELSTPINRTELSTPTNRTQPPTPTNRPQAPTPNQEQISGRSIGEEQKPPITPKSPT